jgi:hypothetical protein
MWKPVLSFINATNKQKEQIRDNPRSVLSDAGFA